jgi:hypothetical protein
MNNSPGERRSPLGLPPAGENGVGGKTVQVPFCREHKALRMSAWHKIAPAVQCGGMGVKSRCTIRTEKHHAEPWAFDKRSLKRFSDTLTGWFGKRRNQFPANLDGASLDRRTSRTQPSASASHGTTRT